MVYVIQVSWQLASRIRTELVPSWSCSQAVWHIPLLCVQWKTPDDGERNCPKHVEFYSKNKLEKLEHVIGCIIRIYHDAPSPERQILSFYKISGKLSGTGHLFWVSLVSYHSTIAVSAARYEQYARWTPHVHTGMVSPTTQKLREKSLVNSCAARTPVGAVGQWHFCLWPENT